MSGPTKCKVDRIRARQGGRCWLCNHPLDFEAEPNTKRAPTIEHLLPRTKGGGNEPANLALCHPACNRHLADRSPEQKRQMRAKWHAEFKRVEGQRRPKMKRDP